MDRATFEYTLSASAQVGLQILDVTGKTISSFSIGEQPAGKHQFDWDTGALPKGLYFCHLRAGSKMQTLKVMVN